MLFPIAVVLGLLSITPSLAIPIFDTDEAIALVTRDEPHFILQARDESYGHDLDMMEKRDLASERVFEELFERSPVPEPMPLVETELEDMERRGLFGLGFKAARFAYKGIKKAHDVKQAHDHHKNRKHHKRGRGGGAKKIGQRIKNGFKHMGNKIKGGLKKVGQGLKKAGRVLGKVAKVALNVATAIFKREDQAVTAAPPLKARNIEEPQLAIRSLDEPELEVRDVDEAAEIEARDFDEPELEARDLDQPELEARDFDESELEIRDFDEPELEARTFEDEEF